MCGLLVEVLVTMPRTTFSDILLPFRYKIYSVDIVQSKKPVMRHGSRARLCNKFSVDIATREQWFEH